MTPKDYQAYVKAKSPPSPMGKNIARAFVCGGLICVLGEGLRQIYLTQGLDAQTASTLTSVTLVVISAVLTGLNLYNKIARFAGAGTLVPITGFANAVASAGLDFKSEGLVTGLGTKLFAVAGPVIVYGTTASVLYGIVYQIFR